MSKIEVDNIDTVTGTTELTIGGTNATSITLGSGASFSNVSGQNYPAFEAYLSSTTALADITTTKVNVDTVSFDTNSYYDNTTNYRYTPLVAGKYYVYAKASFDSTTSNTKNIACYIYKNGSTISDGYINFDNNNGEGATVDNIRIIDMNGTTDYLELYAFADAVSGTVNLIGNTEGRMTKFGAYRIGS